MPENELTMTWNDPRSSRILELELELTRAVINGHRPEEDDKYKEKREELERLRRELDLLDHQKRKNK